MFDDAWEELETLPFDESRISGEVLELRSKCCVGLEKWEMGAEIARGGIKKNPDCLELYISGAYCIRRLDGEGKAFDFLSSGHPASYEGQPARGLWWFHMACYHCQLGRQEETSIASEFAIDFRSVALADNILHRHVGNITVHVNLE
jgi:hypothetical protein